MQRNFSDEIKFRANKFKYLLPAFLGSEVQLTYPGIKHPFCLRRGTSDFTAFKYVLANQEYKVEFKNPPKVIIDAGANIGLAAVYFANLYPEAKIISIEAERSNFDILKKNVSPYKNIIPVHAALWNKVGTINVIDPGGGHWGFQTGDNPEDKQAIDNIEATTIEKLMADHHFESIDLLKIDIEGAEVEVFEASSPWIDKVSTIAVELHDRFKPRCTEVFNQSTKEFDTTWTRGENIFKTRGDHAYQISNN